MKILLILFTCLFFSSTVKAQIKRKFNFGFEQKDGDKDGISDKKDKCPETPPNTQVDAFGCSAIKSNFPTLDTDLDGTPDLLDSCLKIAGVGSLNGCPDTDGDGIADHLDNCPKQAGPIELKGCPDRDNDGIQDSEDACPTVPGLAKFKGCPDTDGDGIPDPKDECPTQAGPASLNGCPDRDGDGIADKNDVCPDKAGLAQFKGCPDTDGDGIPDNEDQCPEVAGPVSNNGCPLPPPVVEVPLSTPILFETNRTVVSQVSMPVLETAIKTLKDDANAEIVIHGHADWRGTNTYNMKLSKKRAEAVKKELVGMGADPKRIKVMAHGEKDPVASNSTEEGMAQNRRAVMRLTVE
jgi:outer membrane protein OmpA-like peptidoglycan-associated protein